MNHSNSLNNQPSDIFSGEPLTENPDQNLTITIQTTQGDWVTTTDKNTKVFALISAICQHFKFVPDGKYEIELVGGTENPLRQNRPIVSYGIKDDDTLIFTDLGVAV